MKDSDTTTIEDKPSAELNGSESSPTISKEDRALIRVAATLLERKTLAMTVANVGGRPLEAGIKKLPQKWQDALGTATQESLNGALGVMISTIPHSEPANDPWAASSKTAISHRFATVASGVLGGAFGLPGLLVEIPATTCIFLRSIASIGLASGENRNDPEFMIQCMTVLAYGSPHHDSDDFLKSSYLSSRVALGQLVTAASRFLAKKSAEEVSEAIAKGTAPILITLLAKIAARFEIVIAEKAIAQLVPIIGAASAATLNLAFSSHFDSVARAHFAIRFLERKYGKEATLEEYKLEVERQKLKAFEPPRT